MKQLRLGVALCVAGALVAACETAPPKVAAPPPVAVEPPPPPPPPPPAAPPTREAKDRAQKLGLDAVDLLQKGEESNARGVLEQALKLDPGNDTSRKLMQQIQADAAKELGPVSWKYVIKPNDRLADLAQKYLGDRLLFYAIAKYNNITIPNKVAVGQEIRIPGREPPQPRPTGPKPQPPKPEPKGGDDTSAAPAGTAPIPVTPPPNVPVPPPIPTPDQAAEARRASIAQFNKAAEICNSRQKLPCAIESWNKSLEMDPDQREIRYKRDKAVTNLKKLQELH